MPLLVDPSPGNDGLVVVFHTTPSDVIVPLAPLPPLMAVLLVMDDAAVVVVIVGATGNVVALADGGVVIK